MFWLIRKKFSGSTFCFNACNRAYFASPYDWRTRSAPSSPRKLTYTPWCHGSSADQKLRTHSRSSAKPSQRSASGCAASDVVGKAGAASVERRLVLAHAGDSAAHLPDRERREGRLDLE